MKKIFLIVIFISISLIPLIAENSNIAIGVGVNTEQDFCTDILYQFPLSKNTSNPNKLGVGIEFRNHVRLLLLDIILLSPPESFGLKVTYTSPLKNELLSYTEHLSVDYLFDDTGDDEVINEYKLDGYDFFVSLGHQIDFYSSKKVKYYIGLDLDTYFDTKFNIISNSNNLDSNDIPLVKAKFLIGANFLHFFNN